MYTAVPYHELCRICKRRAKVNFLLKYSYKGSDIHTVLDKGKPLERVGRKAFGLTS